MHGFRRILLVALLAALAAAGATPSRANDFADSDSLRRIFSGFVRAFDKKDAEPILDQITPDFHLLLENGRRLDRREYESRLRESIARVLSTRIEVEALTLTSDEATVLTTEHQTCRTPMAGHMVTMHVVGRARSWWTKTDRGWKMKEAQVITSDSRLE